MCYKYIEWYLKSELSTKDKIIGKLQAEKDKLKEELNKDENYKNVSEDLYKNGIFDDNDREIATDVYRKVKTLDEINKSRENRNKNDARF